MLPVPQRNTASTATNPNSDLLIEQAPPASFALSSDEEAAEGKCQIEHSKGSPNLRCSSRGAIRTSVQIDLQRPRHVRLTPDPPDHPRADFHVHQQRCAGPPRVVNRQVADAGLAASRSRKPVEGLRIDRRPVVTGEHQVDSSFGRSRLPIAGGVQGGDDVVQRRYT